MLLAFFALTSCGEDEELVAKVEQQNQKINELKRELLTLNKELKDRPLDVSDDIEKAQIVTAKLKVEVLELEKQLMSEREEILSVEKAFSGYKAKHQISEIK